LVDSSVWIDFFNFKDSPYTLVLDELLKEGLVCTTSLIKAEILPGARDKKEFLMLKEYFEALPQIREPESLWEDIINFGFQLNQKGIYGISIPDLIIAIIGLRNERIIFTKDKHFKLIAKELPIELLEIT
jgi:hypothetical protein